MLKTGSKGADVQALQIKLTHYTLGRLALDVDGIFGRQLDFAVKQFQVQHNLTADGIAGPKTMAVLDELTKDKFCISVHGGHGGMNPLTGDYDTLPSTGKRWHHEGQNFHKGGWFYEGVQNRIAANAVAEGLRNLGIFVLVTHHPYKCDYQNLSTHINQTAPYIAAGYAGGTIALHSNAAPTKDRTQEQLNKITGTYVFTTKGKTPSDPAAKIMLQELKNAFGTWVRLRDKKEMATEESDAEENFQVIRQAEEVAAKYKNKKWFAFLIENGFFTSLDDCLKITSPEGQAAYVQAIINTVLKIKK